MTCVPILTPLLSTSNSTTLSYPTFLSIFPYLPHRKKTLKPTLIMYQFSIYYLLYCYSQFTVEDTEKSQGQRLDLTGFFLVFCVLILCFSTLVSQCLEKDQKL